MKGRCKWNACALFMTLHSTKPFEKRNQRRKERESRDCMGRLEMEGKEGCAKLKVLQGDMCKFAIPIPDCDKDVRTK